ncbi:CPBP family intramembrane glutamic endopeptidase [Inconstantimicrobium mannanitabidum]|uniref:CAAX amino protease n=1 Tax=Inconstantimicrobium mannanitabidum TaxID=1604901 RepID=A0ACB5RGS0_9CLOT|nr:type II CAAX endopeptidase family protein [Clostridium sp. TW13]GKX68271.1 CAAX amino protease [Clostridium sp. TW13]
MKESTKSYLYFIIVTLVSTLAARPIVMLLRPTGMNIGLINSVYHFSVFIPCALVFLLVTKKPIKKTLRFNKTPIENILLAVLLGLVCYPVMMLLSLITQLFVPNDVANFVQAMNPLSFGAMFFAIAVTPCITEEITMRGIILSGFDNKNKYIAAAVNGFLFGIFHFDLSQFLYAFALGFLFAIMVRVTNSIFVTMVAHMTVNGIQVVLAKTLVPLAEKISKTSNTAVSNATVASQSWTVKLTAISVFGLIALVALALLVLIVKQMERNTIKAQGVQDTYAIMKFKGEIQKEENSTKIAIIMIVIISVIYVLKVFLGLDLDIIYRFFHILT